MAVLWEKWAELMAGQRGQSAGHWVLMKAVQRVLQTAVHSARQKAGRWVVWKGRWARWRAGLTESWARQRAGRSESWAWRRVG
jgi:hypothetical protein